MFLVELSYNTIKDEITELHLKKNRKANALQDSSQHLEKDNEKLIKFIEKDNEDTRHKMEEADKAMHERKACEAEIKYLDAQIQNLTSEIDKNLDMLNALEGHKIFMYRIFEKENHAWVEDQKRIKEDKL